MKIKVKPWEKVDWIALAITLPLAFAITIYTPLNNITNGRCEQPFASRKPVGCFNEHFAVIWFASLIAGFASPTITKLLLFSYRKFKKN